MTSETAAADQTVIEAVIEATRTPLLDVIAIDQLAVVALVHHQPGMVTPGQ